MNPYAASLGDRDALGVLEATPARLRALVATFDRAGLDRSPAPGKWSVGRVLTHLAQTELVFGLRARMAVTTEHYVVQPMDQDRWMAVEPPLDAAAALDAYASLRVMNLAFFRNLSAAQRETVFLHPERGQMTVWEIAESIAGHELHHLAQIELAAAHA
jgi:uncharacterized damage-inducible protein DinB